MSGAGNNGDPLAPGSVVHGVVVAHYPWDIELALDEAQAFGTIDRLFLSDNPVDMDEDRFPAAGTMLRAKVQGMTPNGQLRLTIRISDLKD